jgi:hypothetical protein
MFSWTELVHQMLHGTMLPYLVVLQMSPENDSIIIWVIRQVYYRSHIDLVHASILISVISIHQGKVA